MRLDELLDLGPCWERSRINETLAALGSPESLTPVEILSIPPNLAEPLDLIWVVVHDLTPTQVDALATWVFDLCLPHLGPHPDQIRAQWKALWPEEFDQWVTNQRAGAPWYYVSAARGASLLIKGGHPPSPYTLLALNVIQRGLASAEEVRNALKEILK